jgi:hypothetical protein
MGSYVLGSAVLCSRFPRQLGGGVNLKSMLEQFSWPDFFLVFGPLTAAWYVWLLMVYSGNKRGGDPRTLKELLGGGVSGHVGVVDGLVIGGAASAPGLDPSESLMGKSKMPEGMERMSSADIAFADAGDEIQENELIGDVLAELKELFAELAREDGSKPDFFRLLAGLKENYPGIGSHPGIAVVNAYVVDHAPFLISLSELDSLWD